MNLGILVFANASGLGHQTRRLTQMLKPYRILVVDSSGFSLNKTQNYGWYDGFNGYLVHGFPTNRDINLFLRGLTHVLCCENPLNFHLIAEANRLGIKTYIQSNYEFCDNLNKPELAIPTKFLMPSYWMLDVMKKRFGDDKVVYLPPPINPIEFKQARDINLIRAGKRHLLHIVGTKAAHDRNGTLDLLSALKLSKADYTLTIKSQHELPDEYMVNDMRLIYSIGNEENIENLYKGYDALILPRRYGGLCLTMNEALMSGLPVLMPDIEPNNKILPKEWLYPATKKSEFTARTIIDVYQSDILKLAERIDWIATDDCEKIKTQAFSIGFENYAESNLIDSYTKLW